MGQFGIIFNKQQNIQTFSLFKRVLLYTMFIKNIYERKPLTKNLSPIYLCSCKKLSHLYSQLVHFRAPWLLIPSFIFEKTETNFVCFSTRSLLLCSRNPPVAPHSTYLFTDSVPLPLFCKNCIAGYRWPSRLRAAFEALYGFNSFSGALYGFNSYWIFNHF